VVRNKYVNTILRTKAIAPNIQNVKKGTPLMKGSNTETQLKIILAAMYSQRRKVYMLSVKKTAFIFLIISFLSNCYLTSPFLGFTILILPY